MGHNSSRKDIEMEAAILKNALSCALGGRNYYGELVPARFWFQEFEHLVKAKKVSSKKVDKLQLLIECSTKEMKEFIIQNEFQNYAAAKEEIIRSDGNTFLPTNSGYNLVTSVLHSRNMPAAVVATQFENLLKSLNGVNDLLSELFLNSLTPEVAVAVRAKKRTKFEDVVKTAVEIEKKNPTVFFTAKSRATGLASLPTSLICQIANHLPPKEIIFLSQTCKSVRSCFHISRHNNVLNPSNYQHDNANILAVRYTLPVNSKPLCICVITESHDQGWAGSDPGSFTWIELDILQNSSSSTTHFCSADGGKQKTSAEVSLLGRDESRFEVYRNLKAKSRWQTNVATFREPSTAFRSIKEKLNTYNTVDLGVYVRSQYPGWQNHVRKIDIVVINSV